MISCIICSRQPDISAELKENIASTIGCEYELVVIDNSKNGYSIFSAYNEGVLRANGDTLCFMHEDIIYHTNDWGAKVVDYFVQYPQAGLIGVTGTHYMPAMPAAQWDCELSSSSMIQGELINGEYVTTAHLHDDYKASPTKVVAVDGLWMCMPRKMFDKVQWDDSSFKGFHCYDTDMAYQVWNVGFEVHLCWDVLIEHKSLGSANRAFVEACDVLYNKWKHILPMMKGISLNKREQKMCDSMSECKILYRISELRYEEVIASHAYRVGKKLVKPASDVNRMLKKINGGGVDVVLITYNQASYIAKAIESVLMQRVNDDVQVRVIVADDCSKDKTLEIIKSYEEKSPFPFVYLPAEKNMGIAANYKRAYAATEAEYVAVIEGDDWWTDVNRLQKHIDYLSTHTDCVMTKNNYMQYSQRNHEWSVERSDKEILTLRQELRNYVLANMSCTVFRGELLRNMDERVYEYGHKQWHEATDWYTHIYLLQYGYGFVLSDLMSVYRVDTNANVSKTGRTDKEMLDRGWMCYQQTVALIGENYKNDCYWRYQEAKLIVSEEKRNKKYQKLSKYIPPCVAKLLVSILPSIWWHIKHFGRQLIPNQLYAKLKKA